MAIHHNNQIPSTHFRKDWQRYVRVHFDQPGQKVRRRNARAVKAAKLAPRPVDKLRPVVRCPTIKYNRRVRAGRGFSLQELKAAGVPRKLAPTIGISVDPRRVNLSEESLTANVSRLKEYMSRLVLFPRRNGKTKAGDASPEDVKAAKANDGKMVKNTGSVFPAATPLEIQEIKISDAGESEEGAYKKLRAARSDAKLVGVRAKRAKAKAEDEGAKK